MLDYCIDLNLKIPRIKSHSILGVYLTKAIRKNKELRSTRPSNTIKAWPGWKPPFGREQAA
jgi:hypothetical protein